MTKLLHDIHTYLLVTISTLLALYLNFFGTIGLVLYGLLISYSIIFIFSNYRRMEQYKNLPLVFFVIVAYYCYYILAVSINGSFSYNGPAIIQLFLLSYICFFREDESKMVNDVNSISKIFTIFGLAMGIGSFGIAVFTLFFPDIVNTFPSAVAKSFNSIKGSFPYGRLAGLRKYPNPTALACLTSIVFSFYLISIEHRKRWLISALFNIVLGGYLIVVATNSRTNMVCLVAFALCYYVFYFFVLYKDDNKKRKIRNIIAAILLLIIIILFVVILICSNSVRDFFFNHVFRISSIKDASGRDDVYKITYDLGKGKRLFGINMNEYMETTELPNAHNIYLQLLTAGGIPSLILFCIWFFFTFFAAFKNLFSKEEPKEIQNLNCFFVSFIICYFLQGIPETGGVDIMSPFSIAAQIIFAYIDLIYFTRARKLRS